MIMALKESMRSLALQATNSSLHSLGSLRGNSSSAKSSQRYILISFLVNRNNNDNETLNLSMRLLVSSSEGPTRSLVYNEMKVVLIPKICFLSTYCIRLVN